MKDFDAGNFTEIAASDKGKELWSFLNSDLVVACLETTTYLQRPAIEGIQPLLLNQFGHDVWNDRLKQVVGKMVRQIMERRGYHLEKTGVKIRVRDLFSIGARYQKNI